MTIDPTFFPKLLYPPLQGHAERWAKDFKNRINRICLHQCIDPSHFKCKYVRYVIVFEHLLGEGDPEYKELYDDYYSIDRITHDDLLDERFIDVYQDVPEFSFRDEWDALLGKVGENFSDIISRRFSWQLFPDDSLDQPLVPVRTSSESEAEKSERIESFVRGLRVFSRSNLEIGIIKEPGKPAECVGTDLFGIRSPTSIAWELIQKMLQNLDPTFNINISNIRGAAPATDRQMFTGQINKAFVTVLGRLFPEAGIPESYKVYKRREQGVYEVKFQIIEDPDKKGGKSKYEGYPKHRLFDKLEKLNEKLGNCTDEYQERQITEDINDLVDVGMRKEYLTRDEVKKILTNWPH